MQTIWARVAQSRGTCRCSSCLSFAAGIGRRSTTAAGVHRTRFGDAVTVFYSAMFATAAVVDSHKKDVRREAWDKAIAIAKDQLRELESQQQSRLAALGFTPDEDKKYQETSGEQWGDVFAWASQQWIRRKALGYEDWKGVPLRVIEGLSRSDIQNAQADSRIALRLCGEYHAAAWEAELYNWPLSPKKLRTIEWSVGKLVLRLLSQIPNDKLPAEDGMEAVEDSPFQRALQSKEGINRAISKIDGKLWELQNHPQSSELPDSFESPDYPRYAADGVNDANHPGSLNAMLRSILTAQVPKGGQNNSMLQKICYNLLISTTPPNVDTYNQLLIKFCRQADEDIVSAILISMRESHIRPNEVTHSATLKFYTRVENRIAFSRYVRLMEGLDGGLALAHPYTKRLPITAGRYRYPEEQENGFAQFAVGVDGASIPISYESAKSSLPNESKIVEKARMNRETYGTLIYGALVLFGKEKAMEAYRAMISEGWRANKQILTSILRHCCYVEDWLSGVMVWREMLGFPPHPNENAYTWMLRLCRRCEKQDEFEEVLKDATARGVLSSTVWELGAHIKTAKVNNLLENAKWLRWSRSQIRKQHAIEDQKVETEVEVDRPDEISPTIKHLESPTHSLNPDLSTIPLTILTENYSLELHAISPPGPTDEPEFVEAITTGNPDTGLQLATLDDIPALAPSIHYSEPSVPPSLPTASARKEQLPGSRPKVPAEYQTSLTPKTLPDQSSWEHAEEPMAATA